MRFLIALLIALAGPALTFFIVATVDIPVGIGSLLGLALGIITGGLAGTFWMATD